MIINSTDGNMIETLKEKKNKRINELSWKVYKLESAIKKYQFIVLGLLLIIGIMLAVLPCK